MLKVIRLKHDFWPIVLIDKACENRVMLKRLKSFFNIADLMCIITWGVVFSLSMYILQNASDELLAKQPLFIALFLGYFFCYILATRDRESLAISSTLQIVFVVLQWVCALILNILLRIDFLPILSIVWIATLPSFIGFKHSLWVGALAIAIWFGSAAYAHDRNYLFTALLYGTFHLFAIFASDQALKEKRAKEALQAKHQELLATQQLLSEASKQAERVRISRDLHDLLGHHLTALTINLQIASRLTSGDAKQHVDDSHQIAKLLLSDVREAVSRLRENQSFDLNRSIELLVSGIPHLEVVLDLESNLPVENLAVAQTTLRCIQEALTNSLRHGNAKRVYIKVFNQQQELCIEMSDDGKVKQGWREGNGITGMRERVSDCAGKLTLNTEKNSLKYTIQLPLPV